MADILNQAELKSFVARPKEFLSDPNNAKKILGADTASRQKLVEQIAHTQGVSPEHVALNIGTHASEYSLISYKSKAQSTQEHAK
jgi:hypothetical protein